MQRKVRIQNERAGIIDLSAITDIDGKPVTLQPKGMPKDSRVCDESVLDHPHVKDFLAAKNAGGKTGWISVERLAVAHHVPTREEILKAGYSEDAVPHIIAREQAVANDLARGVPREEAGQAFLKDHAEKMEAEARAKAEAERAERERAEKAEAERAERERAEKAEAERAEREQAESEPEAPAAAVAEDPPSDEPAPPADDAPTTSEPKSKRRR